MNTGRLEITMAIHCLLILKNVDGRESECSKWLALNPVVGRALDWYLSNGGMFRWLDRDQQMMAETIWWNDGFLGHQPPKFDDEVGEGWLVYLTGPAFNPAAPLEI
jgi:hypothetical protein